MEGECARYKVTKRRRGKERVKWEGVLSGLSLHFCPGAPEFQVTPLGRFQSLSLLRYIHVQSLQCESKNLHCTAFFLHFFTNGWELFLLIFTHL